jgi:hypothetical protein
MLPPRGSCREATEGAKCGIAQLAPSGPLGHLPRSAGEDLTYSPAFASSSSTAAIVVEARAHGPGRHLLAPLGRQADPVLLGGYEASAHRPWRGRPACSGRFAVLAVIRERGEVDQLAAGGGQGLLDLPGLADAGEADLRPFGTGAAASRRATSTGMSPNWTSRSKSGCAMSTGSSTITASARDRPTFSGSRIGPAGKTRPSPNGHSPPRVSPSTTTRTGPCGRWGSGGRRP